MSSTGSIASFRERFDAALSGSVTLAEHDAVLASFEASSALEATGGLEREPNIIATFLTEVRRRGYVGEEPALVAIFLALVSVLLNRPISVKLEGVSSVGKSALLEAVLEFFPPSFYFFRTTMTRAVLLYTSESFVHRMIVFAEAAGIDPDFVYALRSLVSERRLVHEVTVKDPTTGELGTRKIEKPGPTGLTVSTTSVQLDAEIKTGCSPFRPTTPPSRRRR